MSRKETAVFLAMILLASPCFAQNQKSAKQAEKVKVSAKDLAEIKRQVRLMRAEMADLEEKIEEITGQHDSVYTTEKVPEDPKRSGESSRSE